MSDTVALENESNNSDSDYDPEADSDAEWSSCCESVSDRREENSKQKRLIARLKRNNHALRQKIRLQANLKERDDKLDDLVVNLRSPFRPLPTEVLHSIMQFAIPPSFLLHPTITLGPDSPWCRAMDMKMSLIRVNKAWYHTALPLLYEEIVFRHVGPIAAFLDTLRNTRNSSNLAAMVKSVHLHHPVSSGFGEFLRGILLELKCNCPRLSSLGYTTFYGLIPSVLGVPLTSLDIGWGHHGYNAVEGEILPYMDNLSNVSTTLQSLKLRFCMREGHHAVANLTFPCLKELEIHSSIASFQVITEQKTLQHFLAKWKFPMLERLCLPPELEAHSTILFLSNYGAPLKYLQFLQGSPFLAAACLQEVLGVCPLLEHLVVPEDISEHVFLNHVSLKYIDVCMSHDLLSIPPEWGKHLVNRFDGAEQVDEENQLPYMQSSLPRLESVRAVDHLLLFFANTLDQIKPIPVNGSPYLIEFDGISLVNEFGGLYRNDMGNGLEDIDRHIDKHCPMFYPDSDEDLEGNIDGDSDVSWDDGEVVNDAAALARGYEESTGQFSDITVNSVLELYRETLHTN